MILLKRILILLVLVHGLFGNESELRNLIQRIYFQGDSTTVTFVKVDRDFVTEFMKIHNEIPVLIVTSLTGDFVNTSSNSSCAILVVETSNQDHQFEELLQQVIRTLNSRKFVIISARNLEDLRYFCKFFVKNNFSRIFGVVGSTSYVYLNFETEPIQKLEANKPLPRAWKNFKGFAFRTTTQKDIPRVFWYPDKKEKKKLGGCFGRLLLNFFSHHNATFSETFPNSTSRFNMPMVINALKNKEIDLTFNVWGPNVALLLSYPARYQSYTLMVPLNGYLDPNQYFVRPFTLGVWILIGITVIYIIVMDLATRALCKSKVDVWNSVRRTVLTILNWSYSGPCEDYRFHIQILLLAFVLSNVYNIHFTSFLTVFIKIKQYNTKQDLVDNNVLVMIPTFEWGVVKGPGLTAMGFDKIIYLVEYPVYFDNTNSMQNTKFAYAIGADRAKFLIGLQTFFAKPLFHTTQDELFTSHLGYLMAPYSPLEDVLNEFIFRIIELGFMDKWEGDAVAQALEAGFKIDVDPEARFQKPHSPLTVNHLLFAWNCLIVGLMLSFVVFVFEKFGENIKNFLKKIKKVRRKHRMNYKQENV